MSWYACSNREHVNSHNSELLGAYGNFVNINLAFVSKYFDNTVPNGRIDKEIDTRIEKLFSLTGEKLEVGAFKEALDGIFEFVRWSNKFFDVQKPWETRNTDLAGCQSTLFKCVQIISNLAILLKPFLPFSSTNIENWLGLNDCWTSQFVQEGYVIPKTSILFERIDKNRVDEEVNKLGSYSL